MFFIRIDGGKESFLLRKNRSDPDAHTASKQARSPSKEAGQVHTKQINTSRIKSPLYLHGQTHRPRSYYTKEPLKQTQNCKVAVAFIEQSLSNKAMSAINLGR